MPISIGPQIGIKGEKEFRSELREIIQLTQRLGSDMDKLTEQFTRNDSAIQRNTKQHELLSAQITQQKRNLEDNIKLRDMSVEAYNRATTAMEKQQVVVDNLTALQNAEEQTLAGLNTRLTQLGNNVAVLTQQYGTTHPFTQEAIKDYESQQRVIETTSASYASHGKQLTAATDRLDAMRASVHRSGEQLQKWNTEVVNSERSLFQMEQELAKAPNFVDEFNRRTEQNKYSLENARNSLTQYDAELKLTEASYTKLVSATEVHANKLHNLSLQYGEEEKALKQNTKLRDEAARAEEKQKQAYDELKRQLAIVEKQYGSNSTEARKYGKALDEQMKLVHEAENNTAKYNLEVTKSKTKLAEMRGELVKGVNYVEEFNRTTKNSTNSVDAMTKKLSMLDSELALTQSAYDKTTSSGKKHMDVADNLTKKIEEQKKVLAEYTKLHEKAAETESKQRKELEQLEAKLEQAKKAYGENSSEAKRLSDAVEEQKQLVHEASTETNKYAQAVTDASTAMNNLNNEMRENSNITPYLTGLGEDIEKVGKKFVEFGELMTKYVTTPLAALATASVTSAAKFEDGMAKIFTIAMDQSEPMEKMRNDLIKLSNETGYSLDDLTEATYQSVSAAVDATEAVGFMEEAAKLARVGFTTTTKSVDLLTTVINAYRYDVEDTAKISDILLKTQNDGKTILDELASSMGIIIPMASNYNVGLEQIAAAYATMTQQGVKTERATTFLRAVFTELEKETSDVAEILMDKTGKSFAQLMGEGKNLSDVLRILYEYAGKDAEKFQRLFGNVRSTQAVASLVADDFGLFDKELRRVSESSGLVDRALEQMETPSLKAKRAINQLKNSSMQLGETMIQKFTPMFEKGVEKIAKMTEAFNKLSPASMEAIINAGLLAAAIGPVLTIGGKIIGYVGALLAGTAPLVPLIAGITAGFIALTTAMQVSNIERMEAIKSEHGLTDAMEEQLSKMDAFKQEHAEFQQSMQDRNTATLNQVAYIEELVKQYDALVDSNGKVSKENQAVADVILGQLAEALGMEVGQIEDLIDKNGKLSESLQQTIEDYKNEAYAAVMKEELIEATHRKVEAEKIEADTVELLKEATLRANDSTKELTAAQEEINRANQNGLPVTQDMIDRLNDATLASNLDQDAVMKLRGELAEAQRARDEASDSIEYYTEKLRDSKEESKKTADQIEKDAGRSKKAVEKAASDSEAALGGAASGASTSGYNFAKGFADAIDTYSYLGANAASRMGSWAGKNLNASVRVASPSKLTAETGKYFVEGFANSIKSGISEIGYLGKLLGESAADGLALGSYMPEAYGTTYNKTVSAPVSINLTVNGNVDDPQTFARDIADMLANQLTRESEVFA